MLFVLKNPFHFSSFRLKNPQTPAAGDTTSTADLANTLELGLAIRDHLDHAKDVEKIPAATKKKQKTLADLAQTSGKGLHCVFSYILLRKMQPIQLETFYIPKLFNELIPGSNKRIKEPFLSYTTILATFGQKP